MEPKVHQSAEVDSSAVLSEGTRVWQLAHIREFAHIGLNTTIGRGVYVGPRVQIGNNCKIQNYAQIYDPAEIEDGVFVGPLSVLTNDLFPRATNPDGTNKLNSDWNQVGVRIRRGASIGAGCICIAPIEIGEWSMIAAGSVVTRDVPPFALVGGNPAKFIKWVGRAGHPLEQNSSTHFQCPITNEMYFLKSNNRLELL